MNKVTLFWPLILLSSCQMVLYSCQWVLTHPEQDSEAASLIEKAGEEIYEYERKTLSPTPPQPHVQPPFKIN